MRLKDFLVKHKDKIKNFISCCLFLFILFGLYTGMTNLFRNVNGDRQRITGLQSEENIDVVYVGASSTFTYFQPLKAWHDCGFTSYNYATTSLQADGMEYYIREAQKIASPEVFVVEMRAFTEYDPVVYEPALRNGADAMDWYSQNRWQYIYQYLKNHPDADDTDDKSLYFDIAKYHTNRTNLANPVSWRYCDNNEKCKFKGFEFINAYDCLQNSQDYMTDERLEISQVNLKILNALIDYCQKENLQVLFVVAPKVVTADEMGQYNTIKDIVESRGYNFLNANEYYDEMQFDFSKDMYNERHVNCFGAEKYTQFLEDYIVSHYDLPDNRGNGEYSAWDEEYILFTEDEENTKNSIIARQNNYHYSIENEKVITEITDLEEWVAKIKEPRYYVYMAQSGVSFTELSVHDKFFINLLGLGGMNLECSAYNNGKIELEKTSKPYTFSHTILRDYGAPIVCQIDNTEGIASIKINDVELSKQSDGINAVVVDWVLGRTIDSVTIYDNGEGLKIRR